MAYHSTLVDKMSISYILNEFDVCPTIQKSHDGLETESDEEEVVQTKHLKDKDKHGYAMCSLHKKRNNSCTGCFALHKQNPTKYPCPSAICKTHLKRKSRCGCQCKKEVKDKYTCTGEDKDKHGYVICSLHKKRKISCTGCVALHKQNPTKYACPSAICKTHLKRKSRCGCPKKFQIA